MYNQNAVCGMSPYKAEITDALNALSTSAFRNPGVRPRQTARLISSAAAHAGQVSGKDPLQACKLATAGLQAGGGGRGSGTYRR